MKKILKVLSICSLSAAIAASASLTTLAAGINAAEQRILDELHTTVTMQGSEKSLPVSYINQTENYLNTVEVTDEEADQIIAGINETKAYLTSTGAANYDGLTDAQIDTFFGYCQKTVAVIDLTIAYDKATRVVTIIDKYGNIVFVSTIGSGECSGDIGGQTSEPSGQTSEPSGQTSQPSGQTSQPGGQTSQSSSGNIDPNPIKPTGFDFNIPGMMAVAGGGVLLVSAAGVYLINRKKKAESENA